MAPQQHRFGLTAADVLDDAAADLEFAAAVHGGEAERASQAAAREPHETRWGHAIVAERAREQQARAFAKTFRERARIIRAHDEATTRRTWEPKRRPWWRWS